MHTKRFLGLFGGSQASAQSNEAILQELSLVKAEMQSLRSEIAALRQKASDAREDDNLASSVIVFLHLPKAAGTTLAKLITRNFKPRQVYHVPEETIAFSSFAEIELPMRRKFRFIYGHMQFGIHNLVPLPCTYITVVRHPVSRLCSAYRYYKQYPHSRFHKEICEGKLGFREYLQAGFDRSIDNLQTRFLAGDPSIYSDIRAVDDAMYKTALGNISRPDVITGTHDRFDEFTRLVCERFNLGYRLYGRENATAADPELELDDKTLELILSLNRFDYMLYTAARQRFNSLLEAADPFLRMLIAKGER